MIFYAVVSDEIQRVIEFFPSRVEAEAMRHTYRELKDFIAPVSRWDELPIASKRKAARAYIERVQIRRTTRGRGRWEPIAERVTITWR